MDLQALQKKYENELYNSVIPFWERHSIDSVNGGFYNCLDKVGKVYDTTKHMWLQGRQIWMFSKLYNTVEAKEQWKNIAEHGMEFMQKHAEKEDGRVYFSLNEKGLPVYLQRKMFSECFYAIATAEYARTIQSEELMEKAKMMFNFIWEISQDATLLGRPQFSGEPQLNTLAIPMILLNVIDEIYQEDYSTVKDKVFSCIERVKKHIVGELVFENIKEDGTPDLTLSAGRLLNPGHAIEAGWFLKHWAKRLSDSSLNNLATNIIQWSLQKGWDKKHGGIFYFLDSEYSNPAQLEWDMKLWWPHCEALYATLLIYSETKNEEDWKWYKKIEEYTFSHFPDNKNGEWYGYLNRYGEISQEVKGAPYKGCFHVPRALYLCTQLLQKINTQEK